MPKLSIPDRYQIGISKIRELDDESVANLRMALDKAVTAQSSKDIAASTTPDAVALTAIKSVPHANVSDLKQIGEALAALYGVRSAREVAVEEFADDVCDAMEALPSEELRLSHTKRDEFKKKLITLLAADVFGIVAKAWDLKTDDERIFCHARILTDLRPVFGSKIEDGPKGMMLVHHLKLVYHQGTQKHQNFYLALDAEDLDALKKVLERAEAKAKSLKSAVKDFRIFGVTKEE